MSDNLVTDRPVLIYAEPDRNEAAMTEDPFPDPTISEAVGGPWAQDSTVYQLPTTQSGVSLQFQWREFGAVLGLPTGAMALRDARYEVPAAAAPAPTGEINAIDVSNYQEWASDPQQLAAYLATLDPRPTRMIVRLASYLESDVLYATAIAQLTAASALYPDTIKSLGVYGWCYRQADPAREVDNWHRQILEAAPVPLYDFWLDVEDEANCPLDSQIVRELELLDELGYEPGIYTGKPFWEAHFRVCNPVIYGYPLWIANYGAGYTLDTVPIPAGWSQATGHQYTSEPCDRNVFRN